ncbi:hypothetical protein [Agaribacterium sp. ZY112]|uniref:hypothetical protein n=1 Tax=Agaribacterium sp. ZY112 TaxID=3233574 RepID=UPI0035263B55
MCTIGVVFNGNQINTFKQCDLIPVTTFNEPEVRSGYNGVTSYIAMTRQGSDGIWAGSNSSGVAFVAADSYTTTAANYSTTSAQVEALFAAYEKSISSYSSATEAAASLIEFYKTMGTGTPFPAPDISLISGWKDAKKTQPISIFIEYMPNPYNQESVRVIQRTDGFFASTNNFRLQPDSVNYPANHSTYLRLRRAETILESNPTINGIKTLLSDQYYGPTELSICRETDYIGAEFHTQATSIFSASADGSATCEYQINGNPRTNPLTSFNGS